MNPDILQYRKELLTAAPKNRKAKRMLCKEFDLSLQPLLEDIPSPTYQDLMDAFGSPSHMAQTLHLTGFYSCSSSAFLQTEIRNCSWDSLHDSMYYLSHLLFL